MYKFIQVCLCVCFVSSLSRVHGIYTTVVIPIHAVKHDLTSIRIIYILEHHYSDIAPIKMLAPCMYYCIVGTRQTNRQVGARVLREDEGDKDTVSIPCPLCTYSILPCHFNIHICMYKYPVPRNAFVTKG